MSNNYAPCFNRIDLVGISSNIKRPWSGSYRKSHVSLEVKKKLVLQFCDHEKVLPFFNKSNQQEDFYIYVINKCFEESSPSEKASKSTLLGVLILTIWTILFS